MKRIAVGLAVMVCLSVTGALAVDVDVNVFLGLKELGDELEPVDVDELTELGVLVTVGQRDWPVKIAIDLLSGEVDEAVGGLRIDVSVYELNLGVRKFWEKGKARPFVGGGLALVDLELKQAPSMLPTNDDQGVGLWVGGGAFWRLGPGFNIGVEARISRAEVDLPGLDEGGGNHLGLILGWSW